MACARAGRTGSMGPPIAPCRRFELRASCSARSKLLWARGEVLSSGEDGSDRLLSAGFFFSGVLSDIFVCLHVVQEGKVVG